jgi:predicted tellurium resistance membrane protein TerC
MIEEITIFFQIILIDLVLAGAAKQHYILIVFGLVLSILLMATVANVISSWIENING